MASESGGAQTILVLAGVGLQDQPSTSVLVVERHWKGRPEGVRVPYTKLKAMWVGILSTAGHANPAGSWGVRPPRLNTLDDR